MTRSVRVHHFSGVPRTKKLVKLVDKKVVLGEFIIKSKNKNISRKVGYIHVNPKGISSNLQKKTLRAEGCDSIYFGHADKIDYERPELVKAVKHVKKINDGILVVFSMEQLADTLENFCDIAKVLRKLNITLISLKEEIKISAYSNELSESSKNKQKVGYAHVNNGDSSAGLQKRVLLHEGCGKVYTGSSNELDAERIELVNAVKYAEKIKADFLAVYGFERLADTIENLSDILAVLKRLNIPLVCIKHNIIITSNSSEKTVSSVENKEIESTEEKLQLSIKKDEQLLKINKRQNRRTVLFLLKILIFIIFFLGTLGYIYYRFLTVYDNEEISESEYIAINKT